jgi:hypothetical protein
MRIWKSSFPGIIAVACSLAIPAVWAANAADDAAVLHAAAHFYCATVKDGYGSISAKALTIGGDPDSDLGLRKDLSSRLGDSGNKVLVDRLFASSGDPGDLPTDVDYDCLYLLNPETTAYAGYSKQAYAKKKDSYHMAMGTYEFSLPAISTDGEVALVHASNMFGGSGKAEILVLKKRPKGWAVIDRILMAVS